MEGRSLSGKRSTTMRARTPLNPELQASAKGDLDRGDLWLFGPLVAIAAALPFAIVAVLGASIWFTTHANDRYAATFASRFDNVYMR
jgi:type IV secretory pathway TrbD component